MADKAAKRAKFEDAWNVIRDEIIDHFKGEGMPKDAIDWYTKSLDFNVPGGKLNRGLSVIDTAEIIRGRPLNEKEYLQAAVLGWGVEMLQAFFLVSDDLMDGSITRRGQPCWYRAPAPNAGAHDGEDQRKVGYVSINDAFMLESAIYHLLKVHFRGQPYYVDLLELFHETTYQTEMGQLIDLITAPEGEVDLSKFSLEKHSKIVIYKTAYYSFYLPVALAMLFSSIPASSSLYDKAKEILIPLGEYFQVQDDFLDFSGTPEQIGKIGTDIIDNKCSWCINTALALASPAQRQVLEDNYAKGKTGDEPELRVKAVFEELGLREKYAVYEESVHKKLISLIGQIEEKDGGLKQEVFTSFLGKIYKRTK